MASCVRWYLALSLALHLVCGCNRESVAATPTPTPSHTAEAETMPELVIRVGSEKRVWTQTELLARPDLRELTLEDRSAYERQTRTYKVVPLASLFESLAVPEGRTIEYLTTDGFSSSISPSRLLNSSPDGSVAYLAIEDPEQPWPKFDNRTYGAGPFYVVWERPEADDIGREEWPFKLTGFQDRVDVDQRYPKLPPDSRLAKDDPVRAGYKLFLKNCFPCHKINGEGQATFGPDLNQPLSPTEYMADGMIHKLVRDPQSLRTWTGSKMPPFDEHEISDPELDQIVLYLKHKAETRS
ncbi:MAG: cytochrome c [Candidatus Eremiobacteraeota bacterium]|nr:cytochrome c [Candidatus Eremiobacteraeota bacterium]